MKKFLLSRAAEEDLDEIWLHIARDSVESANVRVVNAARELSNLWTRG